METHLDCKLAIVAGLYLGDLFSVEIMTSEVFVLVANFCFETRFYVYGPIDN